jgi:hypothetical protein
MEKEGKIQDRVALKFQVIVVMIRAKDLAPADSNKEYRQRA